MDKIFHYHKHKEQESQHKKTEGQKFNGHMKEEKEMDEEHVDTGGLMQRYREQELPELPSLSSVLIVCDRIRSLSH